MEEKQENDSLQIPSGVKIYWGFLALVATGMAAYTVINRPIEDVVMYTSIMAFLTATVVVRTAIALQKGNQEELMTRKFHMTWWLFLVIAINGITMYSAGVVIKDAAIALANSDDVYKIVAATIIAGLLLWLFRLHFRSIYGMSEAVVGVFISFHNFGATGSKPRTDLFLAVLTTGVYLVVRGLDNFHQGLTKDPKDKAIVWLSKCFFEDMEKDTRKK